MEYAGATGLGSLAARRSRWSRREWRVAREWRGEGRVARVRRLPRHRGVPECSSTSPTLGSEVLLTLCTALLTGEGELGWLQCFNISTH